MGARQADVMSRVQARPDSFQRAAIIRFEGVIDEANTRFFHNRLERAKSLGADLLIVEIDSPGGLAFQSLEIAETLRDVDWAWTVAWIPREALSGAALMSLGCDAIVCGSHARLGDAGPIEFDPELAAFRYVPAKFKSALVRQVRDLAVAKGRSPELAEAMIDEDAVVFRKITADGNGDARPEFRLTYLTAKQQDPLDAARQAGLNIDEWQLLPESGRERILTVNGPMAVELGLASFLADDRESLLAKLNAAGSPVVYEYNFADSMVDWLTHPIITVLILVIGLIALYIELSAPGLGAGGLIALLCAALFFWSRVFGGTAGWLEILLFLAGIVFLLMEMFVLPGFGISGMIGLLALLLSVVMASQDFVVPQTPGQWSELVNSLGIVLAALVLFVIVAAFLSRKLDSIPVLGRLALSPPAAPGATPAVDKETGKPISAAQPLVAVGDWGIAESLLRPAGRARFHHRSIDVVSDGSFIARGAQIRVVEISGNRIVVSEIGSSDPAV
jgi:membrane-bound serine protease (ClpP class)